jgi:hypothetical protein
MMFAAVTCQVMAPAKAIPCSLELAETVRAFPKVRYPHGISDVFVTLSTPNPGGTNDQQSPH